MRIFRHGRRYARQILSAATAMLFLSASIAPSYGLETSLDAYPQSGWAVPTGPAAMMRLHVPFGGGGVKRSRSFLSLSAGIVLRAEFCTQPNGRFCHYPTL